MNIALFVKKCKPALLLFYDQTYLNTSLGNNLSTYINHILSRIAVDCCFFCVKYLEIITPSPLLFFEILTMPKLSKKKNTSTNFCDHKREREREKQEDKFLIKAMPSY